MNKKSLLFICLIILISISSCTVIKDDLPSKIVDNSITIIEENLNTKQDFPYKKFEFDHSSIDKIISIVDTSVIYLSYNDNESSVGFYKYDMKTNTTYELGIITNPYANSGATAQINNKLYFYMNEVVTDNDNPNGRLETTLYEIDVDNNTLQSIFKEQISKTLVYIDVLNDNIISFKGKNENNIGIGYIDIIRLSNNITSQDIIISVDFNNDKGNGEIIYNFSQSQGFVYTLHVNVSNLDTREFIIKQYDNSGNLVKEIELDDTLKDILDNERVSTFFVVGQFAFIRTFSSTGILFDISDTKTKPILIDYEELDIAYGAVNEEEPTYIMLYSRNKCDIWLLDIKNLQLHSLNIDYKYIEYIIRDNINNILISAFDDKDVQDLLYLNYFDIPIIDSTFLANDITIINSKKIE